MIAAAAAAGDPRGARAWTRDDHFRYGHDAAPFGLRRAPAQRYWTEYGACARAPDGVAGEFDRALAEMAARFGRLAIVVRGGPLAAACIAAAGRLGIPARVVAVEIDGAAPALPETRLPVRRVVAGFEAFERFALAFAARAGSGCAWTALAAFAADGEEWPLLCDHGEIVLANHAVDAARGTIAGPPNLALVDNEAFTGLDRWMALEGRPGVAQPLRWSPELVAAQLDCPPMRRWIAVALAGGVEASRMPASHPAQGAMWRLVLPELGAAPPAPAWPDKGLRARMVALTRRLRRRAPGCGMSHHYPLHRLAARLGVAPAAELGEGPEIYGTVAPAMAAGGAP
jgi:hypothetical protein